MKIGIDIDNVIVNTTETVIDYINERLPVNLKIEDITTYSIEAALPVNYRWIVNQAFKDKEMWKQIKLITGCIEQIRILINQGHEVFFVTSSLPENLKKKINHLVRNLGGDLKNYVETHTINIRQKQLLKLDVLIDDCLENLYGEREYYSICFEYPWNSFFKKISIEKFTYASSWMEIFNLIQSLDEKENEE